MARTLTRRQIHKMFKEHFGVMRQITRETGISESRITHWLLGHVVSSPKVETACRQKAAELLKDSVTESGQKTRDVSLNQEM